MRFVLWRCHGWFFTALGFPFLTEVADDLSRGWQVAAIGQTHHYHFRGHKRRRRVLDLRQALEQELPGAGQHRHGQLRGYFQSSLGFGLGYFRGLRCFGQNLQPGQPVTQYQQVLDDDHGIGARGVEFLQQSQGGGGIAPHHGVQ